MTLENNTTTVKTEVSTTAVAVTNATTASARNQQINIQTNRQAAATTSAGL